MKILFIRHGEPNYDGVTERGYIGHGRDLAGLTEKGVMQAERVSADSRLVGAGMIVSSPYTRALQTAAILSRRTGLEIKVEIDLHEWMPDVTFQYHSGEESAASGQEYRAHHGIYTADCHFQWEEREHLYRRAYQCLKKYENEVMIIAVTHGMVISQFVPMEHVPCCEVIEYEWEKPPVLKDLPSVYNRV